MRPKAAAAGRGASSARSRTLRPGTKGAARTPRCTVGTWVGATEGRASTCCCCQQRECTVGTWVGATEGRGGWTRPPAPPPAAPPSLGASFRLCPHHPSCAGRGAAQGLPAPPPMLVPLPCHPPVWCGRAERPRNRAGSFSPGAGAVRAAAPEEGPGVPETCAQSRARRARGALQGAPHPTVERHVGGKAGRAVGGRCLGL